MNPARTLNPTRRLDLAASLIGFALGGFFDGIVLHQILQWHHLLSAVEGERFADLRVQILADGLFHALMYVIAAVGLMMLLRARSGLERAPNAGQRFAGVALVGFGVWHLVDAVLSHWLLGLHRIRMDSAAPLVWDLAWAGLFGVVPLLVGVIIKRRSGRAPVTAQTAAVSSDRARLFGWLIALSVVAAALATVVPWSSSAAANNRVTVVLRPNVTPAALFNALDDLQAQVVWSSARGDVWVLALPERRQAWRLYADGTAAYVSGALSAAGCAVQIR